MTYNLLADLYADSDYSRTVLHPQCPPYALEIDYRKQVRYTWLCALYRVSHLYWVNYKFGSPVSVSQTRLDTLYLTTNVMFW